ncbi:class I SAM-dependent rRNA methyltransferase [Oleidesulfovibrio sp.]|uniref:class I SAM-dependent rRNA methyltransferase n=1 Tax=Oleidesulfovibrio sp. TaxID=2909707 RepID=UPI003A84CC32
MKRLYLKKGEERRLRIGHQWIFNNEVDTDKSSLHDFTPGETVTVCNSGGSPVASAYVHPSSLIAARVISLEPDVPFNAELLHRRISEALAMREMIFDKPYYRMVFAEADWLPGLIVDRYGDVLVAQLTTAGTEAVKRDITAVLKDLINPRGILYRNDSANRRLEGLHSYVETAYGDVPAKLEIEENGVRFLAPLTEGQKTGWFYDQRINRRDFASFAKGKRVLDAFCYAGGFGVTAAAAGAEQTTFLDASPLALETAEANARLNNVSGSIKTVEGDALETLTKLRDQGRRYDVICVDPPAFIKRRKHQKQGLKAYHKVNELAMELVEDGGIVMSCSCSQHLSADDLRRVLNHAAGKTDTRIQTLIHGHQGPDHPVHPAMPETNYLKTFTVRVNRTS